LFSDKHLSTSLAWNLFFDDVNDFNRAGNCGLFSARAQLVWSFSMTRFARHLISQWDLTEAIRTCLKKVRTDPPTDPAHDALISIYLNVKHNAPPCSGFPGIKATLDFIVMPERGKYYDFCRIGGIQSKIVQVNLAGKSRLRRTERQKA